MNCKPGDLAIVIGARETPEMIGHIVEVLSPAYADEAYETSQGRARYIDDLCIVWRVRSRNPLPWRLRNGSLAYAFETPVFDANLRPVTGLQLDEETHAEAPHEHT